MIETVSGGCIHIEIDAEEGTTTATFVFPTPQRAPQSWVLLSAKVAQGIEVLIPIEEEDENDDD